MSGKTLHKLVPSTANSSAIGNTARLESLHSYHIVGTETEAEFDSIVRLAVQLCNTPISSITFVDGNHQFFKARVGANTVREEPLESGLCPIIVTQETPLIILDTLNDSIYAENITVKGPPFVRAYAGVPLRSPEGHILGTVCVQDQEPRDFGEDQLSVLQMLARQVESLLALRRTVLDQSKLLREQARLRHSEQQFHALADNIAQLAWMADASGTVFWYNRRWLDYTGSSMEQMQTENWSNVHPDHRAKVSAVFQKHVLSGQPWEDQFPLRGADGEYRWFLCRAFPTYDENQNIVLWCGTNTDMTDQRESATRQRRFLREMLLGFTDGRLRLCETDADLPAPFPALSDPIELIPSTVRLLRKQVSAVAGELSLPEERTDDLETAVGEAAMNAVRHGGGGIGPSSRRCFNGHGASMDRGSWTRNCRGDDSSCGRAWLDNRRVRSGLLFDALVRGPRLPADRGTGNHGGYRARA